MTDAISIPTADLAETLTGIMRESEADHAKAQARACLEAATKILQERFSTTIALEALGNFADVVRVRDEAASNETPSIAPPPVTSAPVAAPAHVVPPDQLVMALVDHLRTMPRWEAHERARAVLAGAGAFLHATFGTSYASAVTADVLQAATNFGIEHRGGRDTLDTLH